MDFQLSREQLLKEKEEDYNFYKKLMQYEMIVMEKTPSGPTEQIIENVPNEPKSLPPKEYVEYSDWGTFRRVKANNAMLNLQEKSEIEEAKFGRGGITKETQFDALFKTLAEGKDVKVKVTPEQGEDLQEALFTKGYTWGDTNTKVKTDVQGLRVKGKILSYWSDISDGSCFLDFSKDEAMEIVL